MRGRIKKDGEVLPEEVPEEGKGKRVSYHTKRYTDWAKEAIKNVRPVDAVVPKEEPTVLERFDYTKEKGEISNSFRHKSSGFDSTDLMTTRHVNEEEDVVGEDEAKERAAQFITRIDKKGWRCQWSEDTKVCNYQSERLVLAQAHVYGHLRIWTYKCRLCGKTCRLETNFEKHLNTHGLTRRVNKSSQYKLYSEENEESSFLLDVEQREAEGVNKGITPEGTGESKPFQSVSECLAPESSPKKRSRKLIKEMATKRLKKDVQSKEAEEDEEQAWASSDDQVEEGRVQLNYHTMKKAIFMPEEKARTVISSYIVAGMRKGEADLQLECSLCQFRHESEIEVLARMTACFCCFYFIIINFRCMNMWPWSI